MIDSNEKWEVSTKPAVIGCIFSLILVIVAYLLVMQEVFPKQAMAYIVMILGGGQALVQLVFFLHLGIEAVPRWKLIMFLFMVLIVSVIVCGSLWIMQNLNYNLMIPNKY